MHNNKNTFETFACDQTTFGFLFLFLYIGLITKFWPYKTSFFKFNSYNNAHFFTIIGLFKFNDVLHMLLALINYYKLHNQANFWRFTRKSIPTNNRCKTKQLITKTTKPMNFAFKLNVEHNSLLVINQRNDSFWFLEQ